MATRTKKTFLIIDFDDPLKKLSGIFSDVLKEAEKKWGKKLNEQEVSDVWDYSIIQLKDKISSICRSKYRFSDTKLRVGIRDLKQGEDFTLESFPYDYVYRVYAGFSVFPDRSIEKISRKDFLGYWEKTVENWFKTAVFYAVSSY